MSPKRAIACLRYFSWKVVKMECDTWQALKIENEDLKEQLAHVVSLSNVVSTSSSYIGNNF